MDELINGWMDGWTWKYEIRQIYGGLLGSGGEAVSNYNLQIWATPAVAAVLGCSLYRLNQETHCSIAVKITMPSNRVIAAMFLQAWT